MARTTTPGARRSGRPAGSKPPSRGKPRTPRDPARPEASGWQSRLAAADILLKVTDEELDLDSALAQSEPYGRLASNDRAFARAIAGCSLRALGRIDWALAGLLDRPLDDIEPALRALLRTGAAQLWLMDAPDYAAVSATVEAARRWSPARRGGGLLNAVLRRATREREGFDNAPPTSVWPNWLAGRMKAALGLERAEALARVQLEEPSLDLSLKQPAEVGAWAKKLEGEAMPGGAVRLKTGVRLTDLPGYAEGEWWVQDAAAALAVQVLAPQPGERVLDLCAAPGGKTLQLAAAGARVTALDVSIQRLQVLRENLARTRLEADVVCADAREWRPKEPVDAILLDAPCSAMGVLRRLPEAAWRRDPATLGRYPRLQGELLRAAFEMLKPGGRLVYCVCTPFPEEGQAVVSAAEGAWTRMPIRPEECPGFEGSLTRLGDLVTAPPVEDQLGIGIGGGEARSNDWANNPGDDAALGLSQSSDVFFISRLEKADRPMHKP